LNCFPREGDRAFVNNSGGYLTLNFIPSLGTMLLGLVAGGVLRERRAPKQPPGAEAPGAQLARLATLCGFAVALIAAGLALDRSGVCPIIKRIWTPSWALYSAGWAALLLAGFYALIDVAGFRRWSWPLAVVGMNSIVVYVISWLTMDFLRESLKTHFGAGLFTLYGQIDPAFEGVVTQSLTLFATWLICVWLHRQRIFVRL
jgi:heparan-alpha-glucosaminide N-acetyltransferase